MIFFSLIELILVIDSIHQKGFGFIEEGRAETSSIKALIFLNILCSLHLILAEIDCTGSKLTGLHQIALKTVRMPEI